MKTTLQILAAIAAGATAIGGLDLAGIVHLLPEPWAKILAVAPPALATVAHAIAAALKGTHGASTFTTKVIPLLLAVGTAGMLTGCGSGFAPFITPGGCAAQSITDEAGNSYLFEYCPDGSLRWTWQAPESPAQFQARWEDDGQGVRFYVRPSESEGWVEWGAKSGETPPGMPSAVPQ